MNKRQAKKKDKIQAYREDYGGMPLKTIKKFNRQYDGYFKSMQGRIEQKRINTKLEF